MTDTDEQPQRKRARQACLACNARRVKCNVTESQPCHNCLAANIACETRESRRGKHPRPSKKRQSVDSSIASPPTGQSQHADEVAGAHVLASLHRNRPSDSINEELSKLSNFVQTEQQTSPQVDVRHEDDGDVFLGEANSLRYVHDEPGATAQLVASPSRSVRFRYRVPPGAKAESLIPQWEVERRRNRINFLRADGAFSFPTAGILDGLLKAYFRWFHPCFAIVDEIDVWTQHREGTLSPLLLQAMLFIGVLHCDDQTLTNLGLGSRHRAKYIFYNRAKDIYDAEYEPKKLTVIQALFLISFVRAGALLEKDTRHWLGVAISLAQTKALHRSAGKADSKIAKLRRRVWWSLYTRDRQCAAALGLPNRIRDEDCDFESLELSDFEHAFHPKISKQEAEDYATYAVGMTELAKLLGQIVHSGYLPNSSLNSSYRTQMKEKLIRWKQRLPPALQPDNDFGERPSFHANMQHLAYNNLLILLYRQDYITGEEETKEVDGNVPLQAATRNTRIIEDMLSDNTVRHGQIHVITNLFNTLCVHTVQLRRSEGPTRAVAELRAKLCLHGLQELQGTWEVTNWVLELFFQYLDRATAARLRGQQEDVTPMSSHAPVQTEQSLMAQAPALLNPVIRDGTFELGPESKTANAQPEVPTAVATPFSWTSDEANQFLFSQIENEFAFGEGAMLDWDPEEVAFDNNLFQPNDVDTSSFMP